MKKKLVISENQFKKIVLEAYATPHFDERLMGRLRGLRLPSSEIKSVETKLAYILMKDYHPKRSYAVRVHKMTPDPKNKKYVEVSGVPFYKIIDDRRKHKVSIGDEFWAIIRRNKIETFILTKSTQTKTEPEAREKFRVSKIIY